MTRPGDESINSAGDDEVEADADTSAEAETVKAAEVENQPQNNSDYIHKDEVQKLINDSVRKRLDRERRKAQDLKPGQQPDPQIAEMLQALNTQLDRTNAQIAELKAERAASVFESAYAATGLPPAAKDMLRAAAEAIKPPDIGAWLKSQVSLFPAQVEQTQQQTQQARPTPGANASAAPRDAADLKLHELTADDIASLRASGRFLEVLERHRHSSRNGSPLPFGKKLLGQKK